MHNAKKPIRVLVTGGGGNIGQGIIKALKMSGRRFWLVATDMNPLSVGLFCADRGYITRGCNDPCFLNEIVRILKREKIRILFVGSDEEVNFFAFHRKAIEKRTGATVLVSDPSISRMGYDKWFTFRFCVKHGIPYPETVRGGDRRAVSALAKKRGFPLVVKPRIGYGSRNFAIVHNRKELDVFIARTPAPVVQEYIGSDDEEYTAAVYVTSSKKMLGPIIFHRYLSAGATYKAEVIRDLRLERQVRDIAGKIAPFGPCNIQFRTVKGRVVPFEFNIRFSGTTPMRAFLGFNDVDMAIRDLAFRHPPAKFRIRPGVIFRFWNEMIIEKTGFNDLKAWKVYKSKRHNARILQNL